MECNATGTHLSYDISTRHQSVATRIKGDDAVAHMGLPPLTKAQYVQHTYNNSLLKQQLTVTNANTMSWELWSTDGQSYLVEFLEATKDFEVNGEALSVWCVFYFCL